MKKHDDRILMHHGNGGVYMQKLISELFIHFFDNEIIRSHSDSAILNLETNNIAYTTDSFVIDPLFFPGGNIGSLAVCGTLNDLAVSGARPAYLSAGFIIEEGFKITELTRIVRSMANEAKKAGVRIVTGDTKVVNAGKCDKLFINTSGIGILDEKFISVSSGGNVKSGDKILINGPPGEHGMAILQARKLFAFRTNIKSDCANLYPLVKRILKTSSHVHFMRDATRGGVATVINEIAQKCNTGIEIDEALLPVNLEVDALCELLGFDSLYIANEGKVVVVVDGNDAELVLAAMRQTKTGRNAAIIGEITGDHPGKAVLKTRSGGKRIIDQLLGDQLPRIC
ncbi:MAG: hydrogenase expression/formation protein HypE [Bacteroidales bacterium]|jgi:hydrogenase expression/formation protein HypE|nr:hydrogenase expression/formation protein HypE [Bacteroidales bacterium]